MDGSEGPSSKRLLYAGSRIAGCIEAIGGLGITHPARSEKVSVRGLQVTLGFFWIASFFPSRRLFLLLLFPPSPPPLSSFLSFFWPALGGLLEDKAQLARIRLSGTCVFRKARQTAPQTVLQTPRCDKSYHLS